MNSANRLEIMNSTVSAWAVALIECNRTLRTLKYPIEFRAQLLA
jgi:hypothetical protein